MNYNNSPEKQFRSGAVGATIWKNTTIKDGKEIEFRSVKLQRGYKDKNDQWQNSSSLNANDLPKAILLLNKCYEYISFLPTQKKEQEQQPKPEKGWDE